MPGKRYTNSPEDIPTRTLPSGWGAAVSVLKRVPEERRTELLDLVAASGLQGAPALAYFAELLRWYLDASESLPVPWKLKPHEAELVRRRAIEVCRPLVLATDPWEAPVARERLAIGMAE